MALQESAEALMNGETVCTSRLLLGTGFLQHGIISGRSDMRLRSRLTVFLSFCLFALGDAAIAQKPPVDVKNMQQLREACLVGGCITDKNGIPRYRYLLRMGEKLFPAYEAILSDPKTTHEVIGAVIDLINDVEADRRRFVKHVVLRLTDPKFGNRLNAVLLLSRIGSSETASPIVALLSDKHIEIAYAAARTLAAIGGPNELVAMDVWLRGVEHPRDDEIRPYVEEHRDKLKKRLEEAKDPKKRAERIQHCWKDLLIVEMENRCNAHLAIRELTEFGNESVPFLKQHLRPIPTERQKHFDQLIVDLDSDSFARREAASRELPRGVVAESVLENVLARSTSQEQRRRLDAILEDMPNWESKNPELLRQVRAIWVLQQIGTPEAKALLEKVAAGAPSARLTQKAKDALNALKKPQ